VLKYKSPTEWRQWRIRQEGHFGSHRSSPFASPALGVFSAQPEAPSERPVVIALEHLSPTQTASLLRPELALRSRETAVVVIAPIADSKALQSQGLILRYPISADASAVDPKPSAVLATSHFSAAGGIAWQLAAQHRAPYIVIQHGVVTPYAPPLPPDCHLFAWTDDDAEFWTSGREDVATSVVGSEIIWQAGQSRVDRLGEEGAICFLGQLHGVELPRRTTVHTVAELRRQRPVVYRPHPDESDLASRFRHALWRRQGVVIDSTKAGLADTHGPVAGIFSTGILEAAASGRSAYAFCVHPPAWLPEFWQRYQMATLEEGRPTVVEIGKREPAQVIADAVEGLI
jgi:hypothetical protein